MTKWCPGCQQHKPVGEFYKNVGRHDGLSGYCAECMRKATNDSYRALKERAMAHLGGRCVRCGYDANPLAFVIDHVNGDGGSERKAGRGLHRALLRAVLSDTENRYQLLCANCNQIKRIEQEELGSRTYIREIPTERSGGQGRWGSQEARDAQAARATELWKNEAHRARESARRSAAMKARWASGEVPNRPKSSRT